MDSSSFLGGFSYLHRNVIGRSEIYFSIIKYFVLAHFCHSNVWQVLPEEFFKKGSSLINSMFALFP